ncbi:TIGR02099 family protein [Marinomonas sp. UCMA 3892]|uniref:YhdP family protein n=1 Tax=Marinomonas sp. UCMA 3892 TaxID=1972585 RepID=UPI00146B4FE2|nr:YhdP family protein [Marinomonas sp. UCMA 3892]NLU99752.1 TIGR02099 family protein [Marinomonas sp. UCMA 3892]
MRWLLRKLILFTFWGAIAFSALLAIFAVSVGQLLPYLDHYRPQIEHNLQQIMGYPVTLEEIGGRLEGVDPTVSISGFKLQANGQSAITVNEMRVRLDTVKSLLTLSPQFTYIRFVRPKVGLQESDGQWRLNGATPSRNVGNEVGVERVLDYLSAQRNFSIYDAELAVNSDQFGQHLVRIPHVYIFQKSFESLLTSELYLDDYESPFHLDARIDQTRSLLSNYRVKASIKAPLFSIPLNDMLPDNSYSLSSIEFGGDIWLDALVGKELEVRTEATQLNVAFDDGQKYEVTSSIKLRYSQKHPSVRVDVHDMLVKDKDGLNYPTTDLSFDWSSVTNRSNISFARADLGLAHKIAAHFLPEDTNASKILNGLDPNGMAKNGSVSLWRENDELSFQFLSNLQSASIKGYNGIPKASNINAVLSLSDESGYVDFRGRDSEIAFDTIYDESWRTSFLSGYVSWQQQQDVFLVEGRDLVVQRNGANVSGGFRLEVRDTEPDWIALDLHGSNLSVTDRLTYLPPKALSDDVMSWIKGAFADTGKVDNVDVLVQSELSDDAEPHVRVQLDVSNADVTFDENWPTATNVNGFFEFDEVGVSVQVKSGNLLDLPVNNLLLTVPISNGSADWLNLKGKVSNNAPLILATLRATPLADSVLQPFANWQLDGKVKGSFDVAVPFKEGAEPKVQLDLDFKDNLLAINDIGLSTHVTNGHLSYSSEQGITNSEFDSQVLGGSSHLILSSAVASNGGLAVFGDFSGDVDVKQVAAWQKLPEAALKKVSGKAAYTGRLSVNQSQDGQVDLVIDSDLLGANINLPEPVGKNAEEAKALRIKVMQHEKDIVIDADYATLSKARILLQDNDFAGGEVILNGGKDQTLNAKIPKGLVLTGDFDRFYVEDWQSAFTDLSSDVSTSSEGAEVPEVPEWLSKVDLIVDEVIVNPSNTWHNFKVAYNSATNKSLFVSSDEMNFSLLNKDGSPDLHFGFLSWNTSPADPSEPESQSSPISAKQIPNMTLSVDQLYFNENPYGDWQLAISREGDVVRIDPISSKLKTGSLKGSLFWQDKGDNSSVELAMAASGADLAELTKKFSNDAFVSSKKYKFDVGLSWKGHPFYFDRESVSGRISFSAEDGNFSKVDELPAFLKALGIFNIGALSRRLLLDFSDVYEPGLTYDKFSGTLSLDKGILKTTSPISIIAPSAELVVAGEANIVTETLNEKLTATFPLTGTLPLAGLLWGTPQLAGLLFITDKLIGDQLSKVTSVQYKVEGSFNDPVMTPIRYQPLEKTK